MTSLELMVKLWDMANEEVADVEKYAVCANSLKDIYPNISNILTRITEQECEHQKLLLGQDLVAVLFLFVKLLLAQLLRRATGQV